eukprot:32573_1
MAHLSLLAHFLMLVLFCTNNSELYPDLSDSDVSTTWTQIDASLPNIAKWLIGGYCNITRKIWIFGGSKRDYSYKSVLSFDPNTESAVVQHSDALNSFPQYQRGGISDGHFYFNSPSSPYISQFFTTNVSFVYQFARHIKNYMGFEILPWKIDTDTILFVLGGGANEVYILNTTSSNWYQGSNYNVSSYTGAAIIIQTHIYRVAFFEIEYLDITGSIQDIISRRWQMAEIRDLDHRVSGLTEFYNKYSHSYEIWSWGGYGPYRTCCALNGVRIVNIKTFEVTHITTPNDVKFADALTIYVPYKDACSGNSTTNGPTVVSRTTELPTSSPMILPTIIVNDYTSNMNYIRGGMGRITWIEANEYCQTEYGSSLATITSVKDNNEITYSSGLRNTTGSTPTTCSFIGLHRADNMIDWDWIDGTGLNYTHWASGQPSSDTNVCSVMCGNGTWFTASCTEKYDQAFVCNSPDELSTAQPTFLSITESTVFRRSDSMLTTRDWNNKEGGEADMNTSRNILTILVVITCVFAIAFCVVSYVCYKRNKLLSDTVVGLVQLESGLNQ